MHEHLEPQTGSANDPMVWERGDFFHVIDFYPARQVGEAKGPGKITSATSYSTVDFRSKDGPPHTELPGRSEGTCRWIHIPVNDIDIARVLFEIFVFLITVSFTHKSLGMRQKAGGRSCVPAPAQHVDAEASAGTI